MLLEFLKFYETYVRYIVPILAKFTYRELTTKTRSLARRAILAVNRAAMKVSSDHVSVLSTAQVFENESGMQIVFILSQEVSSSQQDVPQY